MSGDDTLLTLRDDALAIWEAGVAAVNGQHRVREALASAMLPDPVGVIALGKVAPFMARGALEALGTRIQRAFVAGAERYAADCRLPPGWSVHWGDHPVPGALSLAAGEALLRFLAGPVPPGGWVVLLSGGGSSLIELPVSGVSEEDLARANTWLLASGLPIGAVNAVRRRLSRLKGGGLAALLLPAPVWAGYLSDVPGDRLEDIASGPLFPHCPPLPEGLPPWLRRLCSRSVPETGPLGGIRHHLLGGGQKAMAEAAGWARRQGWPVYLHGTLQGDAAEVGRRLGSWLAQSAPRGVHLWVGETTVRLPAEPGRGGRNQHLALAAAGELAGVDSVVLLAAGSDGCDGSGEHAGARVDGSTVERLDQSGLDWRGALERADSGAVLAAVGDVLPARVTATNVADLVVAVRA